jgi:hypothetical protein
LSVVANTTRFDASLRPAPSCKKQHIALNPAAASLRVRAEIACAVCRLLVWSGARRFRVDIRATRVERRQKALNAADGII